MVHPVEEEYDHLHDGSLRTALQARNVARGFLAVAAPDGGDAADGVLLVVSELFANAVRHGGGVAGFRLEAGPGTVTVAVHDTSTVPPAAPAAGCHQAGRVRAPGAPGAGGRGSVRSAP